MTCLEPLEFIGAAFPLPRFTLFTLFGRGFALPDLLPPTHAVVALNKIFTLGAGLGEARNLPGRMAVIIDGRLQASGSPEEILQTFAALHGE